MAKFVGETIDEGVIRQIEKREELLSNPASDPVNYIKYKTGSNAWIRLISGVDSKDKNTGSNFNSNNAKKFVLSGGELRWNGTKFEKRKEFLTERSNERGRYNFTEELGVRPEAGIVSFDISHKNRFGTIREANIGFVVWTKNDLELAQLLYLRPGVSVIAEWGNSTYVTNRGTFVDAISTTRTNEFFNKANAKDNQIAKKILDIIDENRINSDYNYDGFIGFITNFSWNLRSDGGYDCTIKIVSRGAIIESLSVITGTDLKSNKIFNEIPERFFSRKELPEPPEPEPVDEETSWFSWAVDSVSDFFSDTAPEVPADTPVEYKERLSLVHFFCSKVESIRMDEDGELNRPVITYDNFINTTKNPEAETTYDLNYKQELNPLVPLLKTELGKDENDFFVAGFDGATSTFDEAKFRYISLRTFLALINLAYLQGTESKFDLSYERNGKFLTFKNHFSFDPDIVTLAKSPTQPELTMDEVLKKKLFSSEIKNLTKVINKPGGIPVTDILPNNTTSAIKTFISGKGETDDILNIFITTRFIIEKLDQIYLSNKTPENLDVLTFVKSVLDEVSQALGGINEFDVTYDEYSDRFYITDRALVPKVITSSKIKQLKFSGTGTTVTELSLQTKISNDLLNQISISATGGGAEGDLNSNQGFLDFNKDIRDRFRELPDSEETKEEEEARIKRERELRTSEIDRFIKFILNILTAYSTFNNTLKNDFNSKSKYKSSLFNKIKGEGLSRTKKVIQEISDTIQPIIPLELSVKMNGISGFKIGQVFRLGDINNPSNILPELYDEFGFIITGIGSNIENNKWYTTLKGITFPIKNLSTSEVNKIEAYAPVILKKSSGTGGSF